MLTKDFQQAIKLIYQILNDNHIEWALVGSANTNLQGMETEPRDLDIVIQYTDLERISNLFSDYSASTVKEFETLSDKPAWEVSATIRGIEVQFFAGKTGEDVYVSKLLEGQITHIKLDGVDIPCFTLEAESQAYLETNREHKSQLIQQYLGTRFSKV